jgi:hypothetical protein
MKSGRLKLRPEELVDDTERCNLVRHALQLCKSFRRERRRKAKRKSDYPHHD